MSAPVECRAAAGGQLETEGHGLVDVGVRAEPWSAELFTETADLRWAPVGDHGRLSMGLRAAALAQGMWITPWTDGAPDDARKQTSWAVGPDVRAQRWLPAGAYAEMAGSLVRVGFSPIGSATLVLPDATWGRAEVALGGWWDDGAASARLAVGLDAWADGHLAPRVQFDGRLHPDGPVMPFGELRATWADGQSDLVATRLGGLVPYVVPLAGAAWAEFWVEDFVAVRSGVEGRAGPVRVGALVDVVAFTPPTVTTVPDPPARSGAVGLAATGGYTRDGWFGEVALGTAPGLPRAPGVWPASVYFRLGTDWRTGAKE